MPTAELLTFLLNCAEVCWVALPTTIREVVEYVPTSYCAAASSVAPASLLETLLPKPSMSTKNTPPQLCGAVMPDGNNEPEAFTTYDAGPERVSDAKVTGLLGFRGFRALRGSRASSGVSSDVGVDVVEVLSRGARPDLSLHPPRVGAGDISAPTLYHVEPGAAERPPQRLASAASAIYLCSTKWSAARTNIHLPTARQAPR